MDKPVVVAVDVGGTSAKGGLYTRTGQLYGLGQQPTERHNGSEHVVEQVVAFVCRLVEHGRATCGHDGVAGIGLAVPGVVDEARGVAVSSMILGWREVPFVHVLRERTGLPVGFGHDVQLAAQAEGHLGAAAGLRHYLYVSLGTGVGSSMILDGRLYLGAHGLGGELAHFAVEPDGPPCRCGNWGCLEVVASADAIARRYQALQPGAGSVSAAQVVDRMRAGEPTARSVWRRAIAALGTAIAAYVELMDPERVVIGGGMAAAGPDLFEPLSTRVRASISRSQSAVIVPAQLGPLAGIHGAGLRAWACSRQQ